MKTKAFTLVELMVVIAIIAILAVGAISSYGSYLDKAKFSKAIGFDRNIRNLLNDSLVGEWLFESISGNLTNSSIIRDTGNHGRNMSVLINNANISVVDGIGGGKALQFDGSNKLGTSVPGIGANEGTMSAWIKYKDLASGKIGHILYGSETGAGTENGFGSEREFHLNVQNGSTGSQFYHRRKSGTIGITGIALDDGNWHHILAAWTTNSLDIYIDGENIYTDTSAGNSTQILVNNIVIGGSIGSDGLSGQRMFIGAIDNVRYYSQAYSPDLN